MKTRFLFTAILLVLFCLDLKAQSPNNIYRDVMNLRPYCTSHFDLKDSAKWMPILKKYVPKEYQMNYNKFLTYLDANDMGLRALLPASRGVSDDFTSVMMPNTVNAAASSTGFNASMVFDGVTQLVIKRAKEELTVAFFQRFKEVLAKNPELQIVFPKTSDFISQIDSYLYANFLNTLKEGFLQDVNNIPYHLGAFLRSDRVRGFIGKNPKYQKAWLTVPVLCFLGDLNQGKSIADCIKELDPDVELKSIALNYHNVLKLIVTLSESVRDTTGAKDWISYNQFDTDILHGTGKEKTLFFGLLYESTKTISIKAGSDEVIPVNNYITTANEAKIEGIIKTFTDAYTNTKAAFKTLKDSTMVGKPAKLAAILNLVNVSVTDVKNTTEAINGLVSTNKKLTANVTALFDVVPQITAVINDVYQKNYSAAIMSSAIVINQYIGRTDTVTTPFKGKPYFNAALLNGPNFNSSVDTAINKLNAYASKYPDDDIKSFITDLTAIYTKDTSAVNKAAQALAKEPEDINGDRKDNLSRASAAPIQEVTVVYAKILAHEYRFNSNVLYQQLLKYGSFMAAVSEAKTTADVSNAMDAAILPVGSSSIKYYSAWSFSINSYIGGSYYLERHQDPVNGKTVTMKTAGVALPIGLNFSTSLSRTVIGNQIGSLSVFVSAIDLGAIASYRLGNPPGVKSQNLPDFTFQNVIAPGGYLILGRLLKTPLAIGLGVQKGPQLRQITSNSVDISQNQSWRVGAFLSVDIPFFNVYSKNFKKDLPQ